MLDILRRRATVKVTRDTAEAARREIDWRRIDGMTEEDIAGQIAANPEAAPDLTIARVELPFPTRPSRAS